MCKQVVDGSAVDGTYSITRHASLLRMLSQCFSTFKAQVPVTCSMILSFLVAWTSFLPHCALSRLEFIM